jgi:hypothetical protein
MRLEPHIQRTLILPNCLPLASPAGELQSPRTGPFFGSKTLHCQKLLAENMDLSPLAFAIFRPFFQPSGLRNASMRTHRTGGESIDLLDHVAKIGGFES